MYVRSTPNSLTCIPIFLNFSFCIFLTLFGIVRIKNPKLWKPEIKVFCRTGDYTCIGGCYLQYASKLDLCRVFKSSTFRTKSACSEVTNRCNSKISSRSSRVFLCQIDVRVGKKRWSAHRRIWVIQDLIKGRAILVYPAPPPPVGG